MTVAFACAMLAAPSLASAGWSAPVSVSGAGSSVSQTRVAGGSDGTSWVVWKRNVAGFDVIQGVRVMTDGTRGQVVTLSAPNANVTDPQIVTRADGSAVVAWLNLSAVDDTVESRSISADGALGPIQARSAPGPAGHPAADFAVALGSDGTAGIAWRKFNGLSWVLQAVKVAADGTSGTIQNLSDPASSVTSLDIGAAPPPATDPAAAVGYGIAWTGGSGVNGNVFGRQMSADGLLTEPFTALWPYVNPRFQEPGQPDGVGTGGDPHGIQIGYERDGSVTIAWVRNRTDWQVNGTPDNLINSSTTPPTRARAENDPDDTPYQHEAVERIWLAAFSGTPPVFPGPGQLPTVAPASPVPQGQPHEVDSLFLSVPFNGRPVMAWSYDRGGIGSRIETRKTLRGGGLQGWAEPAPAAIGRYERPVITANPNGAGVLGWGLPSVVPGQQNWQWSRFSNTSAAVDFTPPDLYTADPGFVVADSGNTMAAYTGIDAGLVGTAKIVTFSQPGITVNPPTLHFGRVRIGAEPTRFVQIRSSGETTGRVTGVTLSGPDASQFSLASAGDCVKTFDSGANCQVRVAFKPRSTGAKTASVTIDSEVGSFVTELAGGGLDQTRNRVSVNPRKKAIRRGRVARLRVKARNLGGVASKGTRVCVRRSKRALRLLGARCRQVGSLAAGSSRSFTYRLRVKRRAHNKKYPVRFQLKSRNAVVRTAIARLWVRGRR